MSAPKACRSTFDALCVQAVPIHSLRNRRHGIRVPDHPSDFWRLPKIRTKPTQNDLGALSEKPKPRMDNPPNVLT
jgi:hypothetical protein